MSQLFSFIERLRGGGDWSTAQRARLEELAERLARNGVNVEAVFGRTDAGDPWCVVKGDDEEVLLHVARVGQTYVVHSVVDGLIEEAPDLETLLRERLDAGGDAGLDRQDGDVVLPFELRRAQTLFALAMAAGAFESLSPSDASASTHAAPEVLDLRESGSHAGDPGPGETVVSVTAEPALQADDPAPTASRSFQQATASGDSSALSDTPSSAADHAGEYAPPASGGAGPPAQTPPQSLTHVAEVEIRGGEGDDRLEGTGVAEWIRGGGGDDTLIGRGARDTLEGGDGDDWLSFSDGAVVIGGRGADTFEVRAPEHHGAHQLLGVIVDFNPAEGDRVITSRGKLVNFRPKPSAAEGNGAGERHHTPDAHWTMTRVQVDVDDDGDTDGYLLVVSRTDPLDPSELSATLHVLGRDPANVNALLIDVTGDGVADGKLSVDPSGGAELLFVGRSLFSPGPTGSD